MNPAEFKKLPIMGILRDISIDVLEPLTEIILASGLKTIEIAMNTKSAPQLIRKMSSSAKGKLTIGAGTVLTMDDLKIALDSGSSFIVLPVLEMGIVEYCVKHKISVFPGALTPYEIYNAWKSGATMVKVFPAKFFGPTYFKEIKGPFKEIELLACGGVTPENIQSFFASGASAVAFGESVFKKEWLFKKEFNRIEESIKALITKIP
jgi:2-dehydro-3-deoxyphosphogluconate aldolase/(4S)-4-hydroxy-2-oxoglutarate aldolase